jgi:hypothetical protein
MDSRADELVKQGDKLFSDRLSLMSLWQEIGENFYPERAEFTVTHSLGDEFASDLMTTYPLLVRRDLGNSLSSMLRPTKTDWFKMSISRPERLDNQGRAWLEWATGTQKRAMYDPKAQFNRATKTGDHDYVTFGQCVISTELNRKTMTLVYRCWHLRDVAWLEGEDGSTCDVHRNWKPSIRDLAARFGKANLAQPVQTALDNDPHAKVNCRHIILPSEYYSGAKKFKEPWVSLYVDCENKHVMEEVGVWESDYSIPRWFTPSNIQYAYSPASVIALPEARLLQAMTLTLLEAGEKAVDPPLLARGEMLRSDVNVYAGGITQIDADYDERLGEALRPLMRDKSGLPFGVDRERDARELLKEAFLLNKISAPILDPKMTAYQVGKVVEEYVRNAMPLFEPIEADYSAHLCNKTFNILLRNGAFGRAEDMPDSLDSQDVEFKFESPLRESVERVKAQKLMEGAAMATQLSPLDQDLPAMLDVRTGFRDALDGMGVPAKWVRDEGAMEKLAADLAEKRKLAETMVLMQQGSDVAKNIGAAGRDLSQAQVAA